jgi:hypothetical protein
MFWNVIAQVEHARTDRAPSTDQQPRRSAQNPQASRQSITARLSHAAISSIAIEEREQVRFPKGRVRRSRW